MLRHPCIPFVLGLAACSSAPLPPSPFQPTGKFQVEHTLTVPAPPGSKDVKVWFPLPRVEDGQSIADLKVDGPDGWREATDNQGNRYAYAAVAAPGEKVVVKTSFTVTRKEQCVAVDRAATRPLTDAERQEHAAELADHKHVVANDEIKKLAAEIRGSETNPAIVSRKLYDWVLANVEYWVKDPSKWKASPVGSSDYCLKNRTGNCTDFHSLWTALARASGIPTRMKYGSLFKPSLDGVDKDASYHCWPEAWLPNIGWVPNDVAVADIYVAPITIDDNNRDRVTLTTADGYKGPDPLMVEYHFCCLDPRRVTWTLGRDLTMDPKQSGAPVNMNAKGYVEVDGAEFTKFDRKMTFREVR
ncbi:MAG: transglutaminase domain-containing protein [Planctomycetota bacterium]